MISANRLSNGSWKLQAMPWFNCASSILNCSRRYRMGGLVVAFRNVPAHGYATLDHSRVYDIAANRTAELDRALEQLLAQIPEEDA